MAKRASLDQLLNDLGAVRKDPGAPASREVLKKGLAAPSGVLVERAASLIGELKVSGFAAELAAAFERMMAAQDPGCAAKIAVAKALQETDAGDVAEPVYRRGLRVRQREGSIDVAGALRGYCALGLLSLRTRDALVELADLLADPEPAARTAAVRGLASTGREEAGLLIRLRLLIGEPSPDVLTEALVALLRLDGDRSLPFASRFLDHESPDVRDSAALALGESRHPGALALLRLAYQRERDDQTRKTILLATGLLRGPEPAEWLTAVVENGPPAEALAALQSLRVRRRESGLADRIRAIVSARAIATLQRELDQQWRE
jgi:HEAT repeat protein